MVLFQSLGKIDKLLNGLSQLDVSGTEASLHFLDNSPGSGCRERVLAAELRVPVRFVDSPSGNIGFGAGHNLLAQSGGGPDFLLLLNPDTIPFYDVLQRLLAVALPDPTAALVEAAQFPVEHQKAYDPVTGETDWCCATCLLVRGETFRRLNGFDEALFLYCEDVDLSWRAWLSGLRCVYAPGARCVHVSQEDDVGKDREVEVRHMEVGNLYLRAKYFGEEAVQEHLAFLRQRFEPALAAQVVADFRQVAPRRPMRRRHPRVRLAGDHVNFGPTRWVP